MPDVAGVDRAFDYLVPGHLLELVRVGVLVRVPLQGRRVRGWVVDDAPSPEAPPERLRPLAMVVSAGPPGDVVALCVWAAWRWTGRLAALLRAASPPAVVSPRLAASPPASAALPFPASLSTPQVAGAEELDAAELAREARRRPSSVVRWPPGADPLFLVEGLLPRSGSALVVVPTADRAEELAGRLSRRGWAVVHWDPSQRDRIRAQAWVAARAGACVVVGGRSAVLAPVPDLAAAIVLDEGDEALREERSPSWHARDLAVERARRAGALAVLVSPVPSLEALEAGGAALVPSRAVERAGWAALEVVDRRHEIPGMGMFSPRVVDAMRRAADQGGRAVCVLNRRGRARLLACSSCSELLRCERCGAALVEAAKGERRGDLEKLSCPRCSGSVPRVCLACGSSRLRALRPGVTRLRDDLAALVPGRRVAEVDVATGEMPDAEVLIGTEAVLRRLRSATAVAFLDFDQELLAPRYRGSEEALWLLVLAARLVGARTRGGRVLVQTRLHRSEVLEAAARADPGLHSQAEASRRRMLGLPPYVALARLSGEADALAAAAEALGRGGLATGRHGERALLVRADDFSGLADALRVALPVARAVGRIRVEVDPPRV
ncbi:MAG: hypothetical protein ACRDV9_07725 [Acidimicrobiia bacterium]